MTFRPEAVLDSSQVTDLRPPDTAQAEKGVSMFADCGRVAVQTAENASHLGTFVGVGVFFGLIALGIGLVMFFAARNGGLDV